MFMKEAPLDLLPEIVQAITENFGRKLTKNDKKNIETVVFRLSNNARLRKIFTSDNSETNKRFVFNQLFDNLLHELVDNCLASYKRLSEPKRNKVIKKILFEHYLQE